jgi:uncharacterized protein YfiM (DUF2279 family)
LTIVFHWGFILSSNTTRRIVCLALLTLLFLTKGLKAGDKPETLAEYFKSFALSTKTETRVNESWLSADKGYHVIGSMISTVFIGQFGLRGLEMNRRQSQLIAAGSTIALGISKELYDAGKPDNKFSWKDLTADCAGILLGVLLLGVH